MKIKKSLVYISSADLKRIVQPCWIWSRTWDELAARHGDPDRAWSKIHNLARNELLAALVARGLVSFTIDESRQLVWALRGHGLNLERPACERCCSVKACRVAAALQRQDVSVRRWVPNPFRKLTREPVVKIPKKLLTRVRRSV